MADFIKIADRMYLGASTDTKPSSGIPNGSLAKETDTLMTYITYDHGATWTLTNNELYNIAIIDHNHHSRVRVYPQNVSNTITLAAASAADTFGSWTQIVPINVIDMLYHVIGLGIEAADAAETYLIQLGFSIVDGTEPTTAQIIGERRVILPTPVAKATELLDMLASSCPANAKLWGRIKSTSAAATDELEISIGVTRHIEITNPVDLLTTWPWMS